MKRLLQSQTIATGLAMFSMFFGAGNVIYPLTAGRFACDNNIYSIIGLLLTAVLVPFLGLAGVVLFNGDYKAFLFRIGKAPGYILMLAIIALLVPFGVLPRCIVLSYDAIKMHLPASLPLLAFSIVSAAVIFLLTVKESRILSILGLLLSPLLLITLGLIIVKGLLEAPVSTVCAVGKLQTFLHGLQEGYKTFDLFAALFFSSAVLIMLKKSNAGSLSPKRLAAIVFSSSLIGASLLALIYVGMSFIAANYSSSLANVKDQELLVSVAHHVLGPIAGIIVSIAIVLACLTTAIAVAAVGAEFLEIEIFNKKTSYSNCLLMVLVCSIIFSTLEFSGLMKILFPFLKVMYPALIVLAILNLLYKFFDFKLVKVPFYSTLAITLYLEYGQQILSFLNLAE